MPKKVSESTEFTVKLSHMIAFLVLLTSILVAVIGFFYNTLTTKIDQANVNMNKKVDKAIYELYQTIVNDKFDDNKEDMQKIETSLHSINEDIKDILKDKNSREFHTPRTNNINEIEVDPNNTLN